MSYGLFQLRFGGLPSVIGQAVEISGLPFTMSACFLQHFGSRSRNRRRRAIGPLGIGVGVAATFGAGRVMRGMLYGVAPHDPQTVALIAGALASAALVACWLPAAKAARVDPCCPSPGLSRTPGPDNHL